MTLSLDDIQKLTDVFATKEDLRNSIERIEEKMATKKDLDRILNAINQVLKELPTTRQEQIVLSQQMNEVQDRLELIETTPTVAHELKKNRK